MATVLVVEDEAVLLELVQYALETQGHTVLTAGNAKDAIALSTGNGENIDLLLTDARLPGMTGGELAQAICRTRTQMKVLLMSGSFMDRIVEEQHWAFIQKPFELIELAHRVESVLGSAVA